MLPEPLNPKRDWGAVTKQFKVHKDQLRAEEMLREFMDEPVSIKHCMDVVPFDLTKAIVNVAAEKGYVFIFLTRRDEKARIRSLTLARLTGFWANKHKFAESGIGLPKKLGWQAIKSAKKDLINGMRLNNAALHYLRHRRIDFKWIIFEEIYYDEDNQIEPAIRAISDLGYTPDPEIIREMLDERSGAKHLASKQWSQIKDSGKLDAEMDIICKNELMP